MPLKKDLLLEELSYMRDHLRMRYKDAYDNAPLICSDEALIKIAQKKPLKIDDFMGIQGINDAFIENYGHHFLGVILKHKHTSINEVSVSKKTQRVLQSYKDRLTNISRRNRNLYTSKITQRLGVDLVTEHLKDALQKLLTTNKKTMRLTHALNKERTKEEDKFHRALTLLYREINRDLRDKGTYELFIAYPFIEGKLQGEDFDVKAPLVFTPVILERKGYDFYLKLNEEKDIVLNRDLLIANTKFARTEELKEMPYMDHLTFKTIQDIVIPFYKDHHLELSTNSLKETPFMPFENSLKKDFKQYKQGELTLKPYMVLGKYQIHSSKIQEDITAILKNKTYNDLLEDLLEEPFRNYDYDLNTPFKSMDKGLFTESDLTYINDLNYSQEKVIDLINKFDKLVIWGPPGTGKSQTITSLIASQIKRGENVLVVSEKKVALDVIKTRLGFASKFALFLDDAQDKQAFYHQLKNHIDPLPPSRNLNNDRESADEAIDAIMKKLQEAHQLFYLPKLLDVELYKIYPRYLKTKDIKENLLPEKIYDLFKKTFNPFSYEILNRIEKRFESKTLLKRLLLVKKSLDFYPIIRDIHVKLTRSEKLLRAEFYKDFEAFKNHYDKTKFFFNKRKKRKTFIDNHIEEIPFFYKKKRQAKRFLKMIMADDDFYALIKNHHKDFEKGLTLYTNLPKEEKVYLDMLLYQEPFTHIKEVESFHKDIFDTVYTGFIEKFEAFNKDRVKDIKYYKENMEKLEALIQAKKGMCSETFAMNLYQEALNFSNTKRIMDIKRRLDAERKWSVHKFVHTYQLELFNHVKVWMMTPEAVSSIIPLNYAMFDLVIFDEASQMYVEKGIPTIYRAKKVVIAGDTKQLRPSSLGQGRLALDDEDLLEDDDIDISLDAESLLDLARYKYKETILNYHYRSHYEELIAFSNYAFYEGKLIVSPNLEKPKKPPIEYIMIPDGLWHERKNFKEAVKVVDLIKKIIRTRKHNESIGVITFNTSQRNLIEDLLDEELFTSNRYTKKLQQELSRFDDNEDKSLFIKNIENVQGDERDIIIFSTAYAKNQEGRFLRQFGWLNNEGGQNRLNVAISRAKKKIYLVTSFIPGEFHVEDLKSEGPKLLKKYLEYGYYVSNKDFNGAKNVLKTLSNRDDSRLKDHLTLLQEDVLKRLEKETLSVEENIGIGGYNIDFGLFDKTDNTYKLGIICDVGNPSKTIDTRDAFYHQEKYLKSRGWTIYRIFASNWYKDANYEMREIRKLLKEEA
ncbi:MAG: AAA domain-containing protein [Candidatus Izemoplasmataceae bacterium]